MKYWDNSATEIDKMTVAQWLDKLTDENWHTERMVVEAIISGRESAMAKARMIWLGHDVYGYMPNELCELRAKLYKEMDEE
jgi:hypothetical protein